MVSYPPTREMLLAALRAHRAELLADGVQAITVFGSVARDDASDASDVDLAIRVGAGFSSGGFDYFGRMEALRERLCDLLGRDVDVVEETTVSPRLREAIQRDGVRAF